MIGRVTTAFAGLLMLGACAQLESQPAASEDASVAVRDARYNTISPAYDRTFERSFTEAPFENGALSVIAPGDTGNLSTYRLVPCAAGQAICAGNDRGPAGQIRRTPDWFVVTGLYGRTFWLGYGGDGYLERGGQYIPLAWNAAPNGTGDGDAPALETPYPHGYGTLEQRVADPLGSLGVRGTALGSPPQPQGLGRPLVLGAPVD